MPGCHTPKNMIRIINEVQLSIDISWYKMGKYVKEDSLVIHSSLHWNIYQHVGHYFHDARSKNVDTMQASDIEGDDFQDKSL